MNASDGSWLKFTAVVITYNEQIQRECSINADLTHKIVSNIKDTIAYFEAFKYHGF